MCIFSQKYDIIINLENYIVTAEERVNSQIDLMDADNDGNTQEVAHEEKEQEDEYVPYRRGR